MLLDGNRIVAGCTQSVRGVKGFLLMGLTADGAVDPSFNNSLKDARGTNDALYGMIKSPDGRIFVVGRGGTGSDRMVVLAVSATGDLDTTFADNGLYISPESEEAEGRAIASNGSEVIVAGRRVVSTGDAAVLTTLAPTGARTYTTNSSLGFSDARYYRVKVQSDGKILAAGDAVFSAIDSFVVSRLTADGRLDASFGTAGHAAINTVDEPHYGLRGLTIQADGKMLLTGDFGRGSPVTQTVGVARLLSSGGVDTSFNGSGTPGQNYLSIPNTFGPSDLEYYYQTPVGKDIRIQADGKVLVSAHFAARSGARQAIVVRFNANGVLDNTYGVNGIAKTNFPAGSRGLSMDIDGAGRIVLFSTAERFIYFARFDTSGLLDPAFGSGGMTVIPLADDVRLTSEPSRLVVLPTGKLLAVSSGHRAGDGVLGLVQLEANGAIDSSFGADGFSFASVTPGQVNGARSRGAAIMADGRIVVAALTVNGICCDTPAVLVRFLPNGSLDAGFGNGGLRYYPELRQISGIDSLKDGSLILTGAPTISGQAFGIVVKTVPEPTSLLNLQTVIYLLLL